MAQQPFTPYDLHAINKIIASFELQREWHQLSRVQSLEAIGYPFHIHQHTLVQPRPNLKKESSSRLSTVFNFLAPSSPTPSSRIFEPQVGPSLSESQPAHVRRNGHADQLPLFRLLIQRVWGAFPGLIDLPIETWLGIERFVLDFNSRNFSTSRERRQYTKRAVISIGFTKLLSSYIISIIKFRNYQSLPTRPTQEDLGLISQLPHFISAFGSRIKFIEREKVDEFLVIYRKKVATPKLSLDASTQDHSSSSVRISVIGWPVLSELLQRVRIDPSSDHHVKQPALSRLQQLFNRESSQLEEKIQLTLEAANRDLSSLDDDAQNELNQFLTEELDFQKDWVNTGERVTEAKDGYKSFLHKVVHQDGEIDRMYELVATHEQLEDVLALDPIYEQAQTWAIMWIAYMLHFIFITGPGSDEVCELFMKLDKLIPYELIKQGLKIINPTLAIRTTVALIFGQPCGILGALSLFQRILDSVVQHEIRSFETQIKTIVQSEPQNNHSTAPSRQKFLEAFTKFVYLPAAEKLEIRNAFDQSGEDIIILILRWLKDFDEVEIERVQESEKSFKNPCGSLGPNLFHDLILLLRLVSLKRDREQIVEMITEPNNPIIRTIKQILEMYYPTIYKVALATDLSKKFGQTEAFLKDLVNMLAKRKQVVVSVDKLVKLLNRHKQAYWSFLNDLVRCQKLCDPMKEWIQSCLDLVKSGLIITEPTAVPSDGRFGLSIETVTSDAPIEAVQTEARSLSAYNRSIKMVDNMQYRLVFTSSSLIDETSFLTQAFQFLARVDSHHFGRQLAQSIVEARPPLPFGWAWWIDEAKLCGRGGDMVDDEQHVWGELVVNSDLKELRKLAGVNYLNQLMASTDLFNRPS
ncbi:hypothetical protein VP01_1221g2 [Puccinia sorghi]|uniref:Uncharacterized protein n=1 Tax=Puccinia sorghi TaxID=27349 RepID=A0A0L6VQ29_9BASI|nr:hypothetical protein VP01_1221g2 [Puccinia sorghi]